jgi:hypothetical protein
MLSNLRCEAQAKKFHLHYPTEDDRNKQKSNTKKSEMQQCSSEN